MVDKSYQNREAATEQELPQWRVSGGDYQKYSFVDHALSENCPPELSREGFIDSAISYELEQRRQLAADSVPPVIAMDIGSTAGISFVRLAKKYQAEIDAGALILVCTDRDNAPDYQLDKDELVSYHGHGQTIADDNIAAMEDFYDHVDRVDWIVGDIFDLESTFTYDAQGNQWPLAGAVAIIHEHSVLQHVPASKQAVAMMKRLLTPSGTLMSSDMDIFDANLQDPIIGNEKLFSNDGNVGVVEAFKTENVRVLTGRLDAVADRLDATDESVARNWYDSAKDIADFITRSKERAQSYRELSSDLKQRFKG